MGKTDEMSRILGSLSWDPTPLLSLQHFWHISQRRATK